MQSKALTAYSWTCLSEDSSLSLMTVIFFRWWGSPLRAARHGVLPLQCVVAPDLVPVCAPGGEKVRNLLPQVVKLWWAQALPAPR